MCFLMNVLIKKTIQRFAHICGYEINKEIPSDFSVQDNVIINLVKPYTMTSDERIFSLIESVRYVINNKIPGDIVECGVWRGGSMMASAKTLLDLNDQEKHLYLFDTFEGMTEPGKIDVSNSKLDATKEFDNTKINSNSSKWCRASIEDVKSNLFNIDYDKSKIHFIKGKVEDTLPTNEPKSISILRLDTDWYKSTKHELIHLFPKLSKGGVLIIDDYGFWQGARKAVDEYISENNIQIFLNRIDNTGRIAIKQ